MSCSFGIEPLEGRRLLSGVVFAINAGGSDYTTNTGQHYMGNGGFVGGVSDQTTHKIAGTNNQTLFKSFRTGGTFSFSHKVDNGSYNLELSFADTVSSGPGQRFIKVTAEAGTILKKFDIVADAGKTAAITKVFAVTVNDGQLNLNFTGVKGQAMICAIELIKGKPDVTHRWVTDPSAPLGRYESASATVDGKLYVFGGYYNTKIQATNRCDVFDPGTDTWKRIADMPTTLTHCGMAVHGTTVWLVGGFVGNHPGPGTKTVLKYNTVTNTWSHAASLPVNTGAGACALVGDNLYFFGGLDHANSSKNPVKKDFSAAYVLDLNTGGSWKKIASMPNARNHLAGIGMDGYVYAIGGQHLWNEDHPVSEVDRYDPKKNKWTKMKSMPKALSHISATTFVMDSRIIVAGGATNGLTAVSDINAYNPSTNSWSKILSLPSPRFTGVAGVIGDEIFYSIGSAKDLFAVSDTFRAVTVV